MPTISISTMEKGCPHRHHRRPFVLLGLYFADKSCSKGFFFISSKKDIQSRLPLFHIINGTSIHILLAKPRTHMILPALRTTSRDPAAPIHAHTGRC